MSARRGFSRRPERAGVTARPEDEIYEKNKLNIQQLEKNSGTVFKESKKTLDAHTAVLKGEAKVVADLSKYCPSMGTGGSQGQSDLELESLIGRWQEEVRSADRASTQQRITSVREDFKARSKQYQALFRPIYDDLRRYEQYQTDCTRLRAKVSKYEDLPRTGKAVVKLDTYKKLLAEATAKTHALGQSLHQHLPRVYENRVDVFRRLLDSLTNAKVVELAQSSRMYTELSAPSAQREMTNEEYEQHFKARLADVTKLTIVADQS